MAEDQRPLPLQGKPIEEEEAKLRRYLLGYSTQEEAAEVERAILVEDMDPILSVIEHELVEDYVRGDLSESDRFRFEERFLLCQDTVEKIHVTASLLGQAGVKEAIERPHADRTKAREVVPQFSSTQYDALAPVLTEGREVRNKFRLTELPPHRNRIWTILTSVSGRSWAVCSTVVIVAVVGFALFQYLEPRSITVFHLKSLSIAAPPPPAAPPSAAPSTAPSIAAPSIAYVISSRTMNHVGIDSPPHDEIFFAGNSDSVSLLVVGSGFVRGAIVQWNESNRMTRYISSSKLEVSLKQADLKQGVAEIVVVNPPSHEGRSNTKRVVVKHRR